MNSANDKLRIIRQQKSALTKKYEETIKRVNERYKEDMEILNKEEKELLEQFKDVPVKDIYGD